MKNLGIKGLFRLGGAIPAFMLLLLSIIGSVYFLGSYKEVKKLKQNIEVSDTISKLIVAIGKERGTSGIYFASHGEYPNSREVVLKSRKKFDESVKNLQNVLTLSLIHI
jgi:hypothetical protein